MLKTIIGKLKKKKKNPNAWRSVNIKINKC